MNTRRRIALFVIFALFALAVAQAAHAGGVGVSWGMTYKDMATQCIVAIVEFVAVIAFLV